MAKKQESMPAYEQSLDIIAEVLSDSSRAGKDSRDRLWRHVNQNPGDPQQALLEHLLESVRLNNPDRCGRRER